MSEGAGVKVRIGMQVFGFGNNEPGTVVGLTDKLCVYQTESGQNHSEPWENIAVRADGPDNEGRSGDKVRAAAGDVLAAVRQVMDAELGTEDQALSAVKNLIIKRLEAAYNLMEELSADAALVRTREQGADSGGVIGG